MDIHDPNICRLASPEVVGNRPYKLFGRKVDESHRKAFIKTLDLSVPKRLVQQVRKGQNVFLWEAKNQIEPNWRRGNQLIGDCTSWGGEMVCTCLMWNAAAKGEMTWVAEAATEPIYGGERVEIYNKGRVNNDDDGGTGSWVAEWLQKYGVLLRLDYSQSTGNPDHDIRKYSGERAKDWGRYGCGGQNDKDALDNVAKAYPVQDVTPVSNPDEVEAALAHGCPCTIASSVGFEGNKDQNGIIEPNGTWPHQMSILGVMYLSDGTRLFRIFNNWGPAHKGSDNVQDQAVMECSFWTDDRAVQKITNEQDSYAFSSIKGFTQAPYDFGHGLLV